MLVKRKVRGVPSIEISNCAPSIFSIGHDVHGGDEPVKVVIVAAPSLDVATSLYNSASSVSNRAAMSKMVSSEYSPKLILTFSLCPAPYAE